MMDASSMASGSASGTRVTATYTISLKITVHSSPFPARSSMYFHRNCIRSTNSEMKKVMMNGPMNVLITKVLIFFTLSLSQNNCMAQGTKITFSDTELDAITHPDFFYTKHAAM